MAWMLKSSLEDQITITKKLLTKKELKVLGYFVRDKDK